MNSDYFSVKFLHPIVMSLWKVLYIGQSCNPFYVLSYVFYIYNMFWPQGPLSIIAIRINVEN